MFEMNFPVKFLFVSVLSVTSLTTECVSEVTEKIDYHKTHLITRMKRFYDNWSFDTEYHGAGTPNITYDCSLRYADEVNIELDDRKYPQEIDSVFIKNCQTLTVKVNTGDRRVKSLQITGAKQVRIVADNSLNTPSELVITDVKNLKWSSEDLYTESRIYGYERTRMNKLGSFKSLYMTGVIVESFTPGKLSCSIMRIKDSQFGVLERRSFIGNAAQLYIVNSTFDTIHPSSFDIRANEYFVFSGNHVKKLLGSGRIASPKVEIVGNAIDYGNDSLFEIDFLKPAFNENISQSEHITSLNISSNRLKEFRNNLVKIDELNAPDFITIDNNSLNCSCQYSLFLENLINSQNTTPIFSKFLLDDSMNNVCVNFENCPLRKMLGKGTSVCSNTFVCPEDPSHVSDITLEEIASELKNLTDALHLFMKQYQKSNCSDQL